MDREARVSYGCELGSGAPVAPCIPDCPASAGLFHGPQMDRELRLLDLVRRDWWILVIVLCVIWAIECHLEGNSVLETIEAPLLVGLGLARYFFSIDGR